jgi:hypothetical protein
VERVLRRRLEREAVEDETTGLPFMSKYGPSALPPEVGKLYSWLLLVSWLPLVSWCGMAISNGAPVSEVSAGKSAPDTSKSVTSRSV